MRGENLRMIRGDLHIKVIEMLVTNVWGLKCSSGTIRVFNYSYTIVVPFC